MNKLLKNIFTIEKKPRKGLISLEWVVLGYIAFTFVLFIVLRTDIIQSWRVATSNPIESIRTE